MRTLLATATVVLLVAVSSAGNSAADCPAAQSSCQAHCGTAYAGPDDSIARSGCLARCGLEFAGCTAQDAVDATGQLIERDVKPWVANQADKWKQFMEGFRGRASDDPPRPLQSRPAPGATEL